MSGVPDKRDVAAPEALRGYEEFLDDIKVRIRSAQARAARAINAELIDVYWQIGKEILRRQAEEEPQVGRRSRGVVQRLSADLRSAFPGARGYSPQNLYRMRALAAAWPEGLSQRVRDLPWRHLATLVGSMEPDARDWYAQRAAAWSLDQLQAAIANRLHERQGAALTNFGDTLNDDANAVQQITRDPVVLDFVQLTEPARERDLEAALLADIQRFMLALGEGFYFAGRQQPLQVGGEDFILDLLFYHHPTRRFVVIDLKMGSFKAEFAGKMNLYVNAVNELVAHEDDRATVGFILCTGHNEAVTHLTLQGIATPIAVTRYTVNRRGIEASGGEPQVTAGLDEEMRGMRRVEQRLAQFAVRRARELTSGKPLGDASRGPAE